MMGRVEVIINKEPPSIERVRSFRNFGSIMNNYQKYYRTDGIRYMLYNERKKLVYIVIILIFLLLLLFADDIKAETLISWYNTLSDASGAVS